MEVRALSTEQDLRRYNEWILVHPQGNLWQSLERKKYVEACGKQTRIYVVEERERIVASALVVIDRTTGGFSTWDIPRGPLWKELKIDNEQLTMNNTSDVVAKMIAKIVDDAKKDRCVALYFSPLIATDILNFQFSIFNSPRRIHAEATRIIDLTQSDEQILASMHQKGRYNTNVAKKHGVVLETLDSRVSSAHDIDAFYALLQGTGSRDGFTISQKSHYARFLSKLDGSFLMLAKHEGKAIAGLIGVVWPPSSSPTLLHGLPTEALAKAGSGEGSRRTGIYYYGASSYEHRHLMAPYLLQWEAMQYCKKAGCTRYDLLGIATANAAHDDPWVGITEFKSKFGGSTVSYPQEQMIVLKPMIMKLLEWKRRVIG